MTSEVQTDTERFPLRLDILDSLVEVACESDEQRSLLAMEWARCLASESDGRQAETINVHEAGSHHESGYALASKLTAYGITRLRGSHLMFHACGVADERGAVVALVAGSGTGKTTAARALAGSGLGYVTDETVAATPSGAVLAYPKPLSSVDSDALGPKVQSGPDQLGLGTCPPELDLARVVVLDRSRGERVSPTLTKLPLIDGLLALVQHTSSLPALDLPLQTLSRRLDACGGVHELRYSEIAEAAPLIREFLADRKPEVAAWEPLADVIPSEDDVTWALRDSRVRRRPFLDAVLCGPEALIMVDMKPMRLSGIGLTIWEALADHGLTIEELVTEVTSVHGDHPDATRLVDEAVEGMQRAGAVAVSRPVSLHDLLAGRAGSLYL